MESRLRYDYLKLQVGSDHDYAQQVLSEFGSTLTELQTNQGYAGGWTNPVTWNAQEKKRYYHLEVWGALADALIFTLPFQVRHFRCLRLDVRWEVLGSSESGIKALVRSLAGGTRKRQNIATFDSRSRSKANGRHAGGIGAAIGSHKSHWRGSVYKRTDEPIAIEGQYQGSGVDKLRDKVLLICDPEEGDTAFWYKLRDLAANDTELRLCDQLSTSLDELEGVLRGEVTASALLDDGDKYQQLTLLWHTLPPSQRRKFAEEMVLKA